MTNIVYVLTVFHRFGKSLYAHWTYEGAHAALANYCRVNWGSEGVDGLAPADDGCIISIYFDSVEDESWDIEDMEVGA
jgi:hypothetical protein